MCDESPVLSISPEPAPQAGTRRGFFRAISGIVIALVSLPATWARAKKVGVSLSKINELQSVGGSKVVMIKDTKVLLIRDSDASIKALNPTCTHKKCEVKYKADGNNLYCKCHKSAFKLDGTVTAGPAPRPLQTYEASLHADQIVIALPD